MKINKSCNTCEFNFGGTCASHDSFKEYGWKIEDFDAQRDCWSVSLDYSIELAQQLPEEERLLYENSYDFNIKDLLKRIETGKWGVKFRGKRTVRTSEGREVIFTVKELNGK